ncbi:MAG: ankyrin repeat domain-containing protein [Alphaproteobacteria bacterium]|nr:ankyrin repeat domain-containing protein [Alphaproteobacteria bacterium]
MTEDKKTEPTMGITAQLWAELSQEHDRAIENPHSKIDSQLCCDLIAQGADVNAKDASSGETLLMKAAWHGLADVVELALAHGACITDKDLVRQSALHYTNNPATMKLLLDHGADINATDQEGYTPLHISIHGGDKDAALCLIQHGAALEIKDKNESRTPLVMAARHGRIKVVHALLEQGANMEAKDGWGMTALIAASRSGWAEIVRTLLMKGADIEARDYKGDTAAVWAKRFMHPEVADTIVQESVRRTKAAFQQAADQGTPRPRKIIRPGKPSKKSFDIK